MIKFWRSLDEWRPAKLNCFGDGGGDGGGGGDAAAAAGDAAAAAGDAAAGAGWASGDAAQAAADAQAGVSSVAGTGFAGTVGDAWAGAPSGIGDMGGMSVAGDIGGLSAAPGGWSAGDALGAAAQAMAGESNVGGIGGYSGWADAGLGGLGVANAGIGGLGDMGWAGGVPGGADPMGGLGAGLAGLQGGPGDIAGMFSGVPGWFGTFGEPSYQSALFGTGLAPNDVVAQDFAQFANQTMAPTAPVGYPGIGQLSGDPYGGMMGFGQPGTTLAPGQTTALGDPVTTLGTLMASGNPFAVTQGANWATPGQISASLPVGTTMAQPAQPQAEPQTQIATTEEQQAIQDMVARGELPSINTTAPTTVESLPTVSVANPTETQAQQALATGQGGPETGGWSAPAATVAAAASAAQSAAPAASEAPAGAAPTGGGPQGGGPQGGAPAGAPDTSTAAPADLGVSPDVGVTPGGAAPQGGGLEGALGAPGGGQPAIAAPQGMQPASPIAFAPSAVFPAPSPIGAPGVAPGVNAPMGPSGGGAGPLGGNVDQAQGRLGATRSQAISGRLGNVLQQAGRAAGVNVTVKSGGQPPTGKGRVGSHRHDQGMAADVSLTDARDGHTLSMNNPQDRAKMAQFARAARAAGATGIGAGEAYMGAQTMHVGFGKEATWGAGGQSSQAPGWLSQATAQGRADAARGTAAAAAGAAGATAPAASEAPAPAPGKGGRAGRGQLQALGYSPSLAQVRAAQIAEINNSPQLQARLANLIGREVGGQSRAAQQAFTETVLNRAAARGQSVAQAIDPATRGGGYFPSTSFSPGRAISTNQFQSILGEVSKGSNTTNYATGNASGHVGFGKGGKQTATISGEKFGIEGRGSDHAFAQTHARNDQQGVPQTGVGFGAPAPPTLGPTAPIPFAPGTQTAPAPTAPPPGPQSSLEGAGIGAGLAGLGTALGGLFGIGQAQAAEAPGVAEFNALARTSIANTPPDQRGRAQDMFSKMTTKDKLDLISGKTTLMDIIARQNNVSVQTIQTMAPQQALNDIARTQTQINQIGRDVARGNIPAPAPPAPIPEVPQPTTSVPFAPTDLSPNQVVAQDFSALAAQPGLGLPSWAQSVSGVGGLAPAPAPNEVSPNQVVAQDFSMLPGQPLTTQGAFEQASQEAQSDPQTAMEVAQAYPQAVNQIAAYFKVDEGTAAMMLLQSHPADFPPIEAAPPIPKKTAKGGRVKAEPSLDPRQTWYPEYPHFNDAAWEAAVESWPESENVEDRRFHDPTMQVPTPQWTAPEWGARPSVPYRPGGAGPLGFDELPNDTQP